MRFWNRGALYLVGLVLVACDGQPAPPARGGGGGGATQTPAPVRDWVGEPETLPVGPSTQGLLPHAWSADRWETVMAPPGTDAASFETGKWLTSTDSQEQTALFPSTRLSIRRLVNRLPSAYRFETTAWVARARGQDPVRDTGVLAMIPYLRDAQHHVIVSLAPGLLEAWICDGQAPGQSWPVSKRLWSEPVHPPRTAGQASVLTCDVDTRTGTLVIHLDGQQRARVVHAFLAVDPSLSVGLAVNGSHVKFTRLGLWSLDPSRNDSRDPAPPPAMPTPTPRSNSLPALTPTTVPRQSTVSTVV